MRWRADHERIGQGLFRLGMGLLFVWAGTVKARNPVVFLASLENYRLLSYGDAKIVALILPSLEILCGLALILRKGVRLALGILLTLMLIFMAALGSAQIRNIDLACGCFVLDGRPVSYAWVWMRDLGMMIGLGTIAWGNRRRKID